MGHVRKLWIEGSAGRLEAAHRPAAPARGTAVVAHPHPLYGGTLDHPVVFHTDRELNRAGLATLRFNFRGTGESEGEYDDGPGEADDVARAAAWLRETVPGVPQLLVGYSFGALCSLSHAAGDDRITGVIVIGLPVRLYPIDELEHLDLPLAVVQGSLDEFGPPDEVRDRLERAGRPVALRVIEGATHFFPQHAPQVAAAVVAAAETLLGTQLTRF
jgi:alpha/beta superfamily hydrolase